MLSTAAVGMKIEAVLWADLTSSSDSPLQRLEALGQEQVMEVSEIQTPAAPPSGAPVPLQIPLTNVSCTLTLGLAWSRPWGMFR